MSDNNGKKSGITIAKVAVVAVFILAVSILLTYIFRLIGKDNGSLANLAKLLQQLSIIIATTITVIVSFDRIKSFNKKGWLYAFIVAIVVVAVFLVLDFVSVIQAL